MNSENNAKRNNGNNRRNNYQNRNQYKNRNNNGKNSSRNNRGNGTLTVIVKETVTELMLTAKSITSLFKRQSHQLRFHS